MQAIFTAKTSENAQTENTKHGRADDYGIGNFKFGPLIAKGCSAAVYQARHRDLDIGNTNGLEWIIIMTGFGDINM